MRQHKSHALGRSSLLHVFCFCLYCLIRYSRSDPSPLNPRHFAYLHSLKPPGSRVVSLKNEVFNCCLRQVGIFCNNPSVSLRSPPGLVVLLRPATCPADVLNIGTLALYWIVKIVFSECFRCCIRFYNLT